jgi:iron complex outermembrane receptor protein
MTPHFKAVRLAAAMATPLMVQTAWAQEQPEATNLDVVVVTAQKVSQSVIDVPLSISVLGGDDLDRTQSLNMQDFAKQVPGLQLSQNTPGFGRLVLRGINTGGVASTVGVYVDETTFGSSSGLATARSSRATSIPSTSRASRYCADRKARCMARARWAECSST